MVFAGAALLTAILLGIAFWYMKGGDGETIYFEAPILCQAFTDEEAGAVLSNRLLNVEGKVQKVGSEGERSFVILDGSPNGVGVRCFFEGTRGLKLVDLEPGEKIVVEGKVTGAAGGVVTMTDCRRVE